MCIRLVASLLSVLVFALVAAACGDGAGGGNDGNDSSASTGDLELTQQCTHEQLNEIRYPEGWHADDGCEWFHPEPFDLPEAQYVTGLAVHIRVEPVALQDVAQGGPTTDVRDREQIELDGRSAVRAEVVTTDAGLVPEGTRIRYVAIELDDERTAQGSTFDHDDLDFHRNREVLDLMMRELRLDDRDDADQADPAPALIGQPTVRDLSTDDFPDRRIEPALLSDVRAASHEPDDAPPFDRIVLEFEPGSREPSWRAGYIDSPVRQDGSGRVLPVSGDAVLEIRMSPAAGVDLAQNPPRQTYDGADRISLQGNVVTEIVKVGDFEAQLAWAIGVNHPGPFAIGFLESPPRLVIDLVASP
jgi:hypothetical protein